MLPQPLKKAAAVMAPHMAARELARRYAKSVKFDADNVSSTQELNTLLRPYEVVSFDLFDTIIWREIALADVHRKTSEFADRFLCGDDGPLPEGLLLHSRGRFQEMVKQCGMAETPPRNEVDLREVFDAALSAYIRTPRQRAAAVQALLDYEMETEARILTVDPDMRALLERLRAQGKMVILVSDMYLTEDLMLPLLERLGLKDLFDHIFVSATVGVTKHSGLLFAHVDETLGLSEKRRFHIGDNWTNDVTRPREFGWDALHYFNPVNEERKRALEAAETLGARRQIKAGQNLLAQMRIDSEGHGTLRMMAAGLSLFARQALSTGITGGYDRILFLTRDGTLFHELADQFLADCGALPNLPLPAMEEFAFSRRAGILLNYPEMTAPHWEGYLRFNTEWVVQHPASLRGVLKAFGLKAEDLTLAPHQQQIVEACLADNGSKTDIGLSEMIEDNADLLKRIHAELITRRDRIRRYIKEKGLLSRNEKILMVDIGYSGTAAKALSEYINLEERGGNPVRARLSLMMLAGNRFLENNLPQMHPRISLLPPALIGRDNWQQRALAANFSWLEPFTVDRRRGSLRDFTPGPEGTLEPVFSPPAAQDVTHGIDRAELLEAAREIEGLLRQSPVPEGQSDELVVKTITQRFTRPKRATVRSMERVTHHAGISEVRSNDVIVPVRIAHLRSDVRHCMYEDHWVQGSLKAARLGWLNFPFNRLVGLITK